MKEELYYRNLVRNKNIILSKELDEDVVILKKYDRNEFIITKDNLSKINIEYLKKINFSNKRIIISSLIFDIFNQDDVQKAENSKFPFVNIKFKNIYLSVGNKQVQKCFDKIKMIIDNYDIEKKLYVFYYDSRVNYFIDDLNKLIKTYLIKDEYERYSYIYDVVCDELDRRYRIFNICDFKDSICVRKRLLVGKKSSDTLCYGCCYTKGRVCPYLKNSSCTIKSIACKFFACNHLKSMGINYKPREFLLIKNFFNYHDISIIENNIYTPKKDTLKLMLNN